MSADPAAWRGRWRSRWRKLRRDPAAFADDLPSRPLRALALGALAAWTALDGMGTRRRSVALSRRGPDGYDLHGVPPQWLEVRPEEGGFVLAAFSLDGAFLAAAEASAERPGVLALRGRPARITAYRIAGEGDLPQRLAARPMRRGDLLRRARDSGAGLAAALRQTWPPAERRAAEPSRAAYQAWIARNELGPEHSELLGSRISGLSHRPKVSILMPVHDPRPEHLAAAIASVQAQAYPDWELCIADDGSASPEVRVILAAHAFDPRVRQVRLDPARGVGAATNAALALATGDIAVFLDHDDLLAVHALAFIVFAFDFREEKQAVYSDEDTIDAEGRRSAPLFKPGYDGLRLLSQNYVNHAFAVRMPLLRALGGLREGMDGVQDHDLVLRVEEASQGMIGHIPAVLYHWRIYPGGRSLSQTRRDELDRLRRDMIGETRLWRSTEGGGGPRPPGETVVVLSPPRQPSVTAIVPTRDRPALLEACVMGLLDRTDHPSLRVRIVDNGSQTHEALRALERLSALDRVEVMRIDAPFNFSALNNAAAKGAETDMLAFVNDDILVIEPDWLKCMTWLAADTAIGAVGAKLYYPDGRLQHAGLVLGLGPQGIAGHEFRGQPGDTPGPQRRLMVPRTVSAVTAACLVVERHKFEAVGGFDESFAVAFNDVDLCLRLQACGFNNAWTPDARLIHVESATRGADTDPVRSARFLDEAARMKARWGTLLSEDPYYSPNLTLEDESFGLARRARLTTTVMFDSR